MDFCGVFDGHGPWGHFVSKTVRKLMPPLLLCNWQEAVELNGNDLDCCLGSEKKQIQFDIWEQSFYKACAAVDQELKHYPAIDSFYSGTTALALVRQVTRFLLFHGGKCIGVCHIHISKYLQSDCY